MAKKISQLTQAAEVKSDDVTVIVQDGETKKLPLNMMVTKQDIENKKVAGLAKLDEIEATYENDTYTPTITVKNKSSVKTGEGDEVDYSANVMDGHAKSAILSGNTLVNLFNKSQDSYTIEPTKSIGFKSDLYKTSTTYLIKFDVVSSNTNNKLMLQYYLNGQWLVNYELNIKLGINKFVITSFSNQFNTIKLYYNASYGSETVELKDIMLIEYQQGMENWDIPYFEGMQSVKLPVLKTVGKNLFDISNASYGYITSTGEVSTGKNNVKSAYIPIKPNTKYSINAIGSKVENSNFFSWYDSNKNFIGRHKAANTSISPDNAKYLIIHNNYGGSENIEDLTSVTLMLTEGDIAEYEPYKSNILTVNEDVELRGIGDVQDTLDLITGEKVERIGEFVLNGNDETWDLAQDRVNTMRLNCYSLNIPIGVNGSLLKTDKFPYQSPTTGDQEGAVMGGGAVSPKVPSISILKTRLPSSDIDGFKQWLSQNPITVQYQLATESIKTVDLMPSGTHPSTTPYCWKNGLIQLSSSGLLPNLEYSVVTSRAGQINQNATMIVKNDKRIFDLEILLAGGLVNTTYQALTLQNQVETGLSKVSLNSETEPDYLLYHMIMKLIEEKAYKLDDLTEKVSVFYLYEKLSDEQFETIYSALYPFVEDEIVEEPVVEELPEVVEDEVIM